MKIFFIPSWYPSPREPISGLFFREQAKALGEKSRHQIVVSLWGQSNFALPLNNLPKSISNLIEFLKSKPKVTRISRNTFEFLRPALSWNHHVFAGNMSSILQANEENFQKAQNKFGKIDIIHAYVSFPAGYIAMRLADKYNIPYIISEVMGPFPFPKFLKGNQLSPLLKQPLDRASCVLAISPSLKKEIENFGINDAIALPFMVDENYFKPANNFDKRISFFTLATISHAKGIGDLLSAVELVIKKNPEILFRIGGEGKERNFYEKQAILMGLDKNIIWLGRLSRSQAKREFQKCHGFILPSHLDTFSVVCVEAIACGKPVIATRCGGPEFIINKQNGILVKVGNPRQMSRAILYLSENLEKYPVQKIRQDFLNKFSKKVIVNKIINIYKRTVKNVRNSRNIQS